MTTISCCWRLRELSLVRSEYATEQGVDDDCSPTTVADELDGVEELQQVLDLEQEDAAMGRC